MLGFEPGTAGWIIPSPPYSYSFVCQVILDQKSAHLWQHIFCRFMFLSPLTKEWSEPTLLGFALPARASSAESFQSEPQKSKQMAPRHPKKTIFEAVMVSVFGFNIILSVKGIYRTDILLEMKNITLD